MSSVKSSFDVQVEDMIVRISKVRERCRELAAVRLLPVSPGKAESGCDDRCGLSTWAVGRRSKRGTGGNEYTYSKEKPEDGGVITSLMDVYNNNNIWLVEAIARAATDNKWPRVDVKSGNTGPGVNGGFQGLVKSPMNNRRAYWLPGIGLAGDWPGAWTQTYAQADTQAGMHGFDQEYFV